jgi:periplasmic protein TonB
LPLSQNQSAGQQLAPEADPGSQPSTRSQNDTQEPDGRETSVTTQPLDGQGRGISRLPQLSDEDLEKFARLPHPEGRRTGRPFSGIDTAISLNTTEVKYLSYFTHLKQKIDRAWSYPVEATTQGIHGQLVLFFVLRRSGQVSRVELLRSSGSKLLDKEAWEAVLNVGPFDPFPPQIPEEELHIRARFTYVLETASQRTRVH